MPALVTIRRTVGRAQVDARPFRQQLGVVGVVGALVALGASSTNAATWPSEVV